MKWPPRYKISLAKFHEWLHSCINIWWCYQGTMRNSSFSLEQSVTCSCPTIITPVAGSELCHMHTKEDLHVNAEETSCHDGGVNTVGFFLLLRSHIHNPLKLLHNSSNGSPQGRHQWMQNKNNNGQLQACATAHYWTIVSGFDNYMYDSLLNKEILTLFIAERGHFKGSLPPAVATPAWNSLHYRTMFCHVKKSTCHQHEACVCLFVPVCNNVQQLYLASTSTAARVSYMR